VIQNDGNLVVYNPSNTVLWDAGISLSGEPRVNVTTGNPLDDVCGKRLSSCKARFGENAELPFGSFPSLGSFTG
jgi:phage-related protein